MGDFKEPVFKKLKLLDDDDSESEVVLNRLNEHINIHDENRISIQNTIQDIFTKLREAIDVMEDKLSSELEEVFTKEDERLQASLNNLREAVGAGIENDIQEFVERAKSELLVAQSYELIKKKDDTQSSILPNSYDLVVTKKLRDECIETRNPRDLSVHWVSAGQVHLNFTSLTANDERVLKENGFENEIIYKALLRKKGENQGGGGEEESQEEGKTYTLRRNGDHFSFTPNVLEPEGEYEVKVKMVYKDKESEWSEKAGFEAPEYSQCCIWNRCSDKTAYLIDESNPCIATKSNFYGYDVITGNIQIPPNSITSWNIKVLKSRYNSGNGIYVGVKSIDDDNAENYIKLFNCYESSICSYISYSYLAGEAYGIRKPKGKYIHIGDKIGVTVDTTKGEISFSVNGVNLGVASCDVPLYTQLVPCVFLENCGDSVELIFSNIKENVNNNIHVPSNITVVSVTHNSIALSWTGTVRGTYYQIETNSSKCWDTAQRTFFTKNNLCPDTEYSFRLRAVRRNSVSKWSDVLRVRTNKEVSVTEENESQENAISDDDQSYMSTGESDLLEPMKTNFNEGLFINDNVLLYPQNNFPVGTMIYPNAMTLGNVVPLNTMYNASFVLPTNAQYPHYPKR